MDFDTFLLVQFNVVLIKLENVSTTCRNMKPFDTLMCAKAHCA